MLVNFYQRPAARRVQGLLQALRCKASFVSRSVLRWRCHCHPLSIQYGWVRRVHCSHTCQAELQFVVIVRQTPRFHHPRIGGRNPAIATAADKSRVSVQAPCHPGSECEEFVGFSASKNAAARTSSSNPAMNIDNSWEWWISDNSCKYVLIEIWWIGLIIWWQSMIIGDNYHPPLEIMIIFRYAVRLYWISWCGVSISIIMNLHWWINIWWSWQLISPYYLIIDDNYGYTADIDHCSVYIYIMT